MVAAVLDFSDFPKQWVISQTPLPSLAVGKADFFAGLHIAAASAVPILRLLDASGEEEGRLLGWVIEGSRLHSDDDSIRLRPGQSPEMLYCELAGRFVMLWREGGRRLLVREDSSGGLPAIYAPQAGLVGATVSLLNMLSPLPVDTEIEGIFEFPARRGFLPFGLTPRCGAHRLMPNHSLDLADFTVARVWPRASVGANQQLTPNEIGELVTEAADILRCHVNAILSQGETVLYLSGGYDSRLILAAARGRTGNLRAETLGDRGSLDAHIAARVARSAGVAHRVVPVLPATDADVSAWLSCSGRMMCDTVTGMGPTATATDTGRHPLSGTGADFAKGATFAFADIGAPIVTLDALLAKYRLPDHPRIRRAGQDWIDGLAECPQMDAAMALDLARIEQRHGAWGGAAVYGHAVSRPSLQPFSGQRLYEITLEMPKSYRLRKGFFSDLMQELWPELLEIPINRASGVARLRFWKAEARNAIPSGIKSRMRRLRTPGHPPGN